jgi:hypothetical protein
MYPSVEVTRFYEQSMEILGSAGIPFLVGGAFALRVYAGVERDTKDFDLMLHRRDVERAITAFRAAGFPARVLFPHWLAKVHHGESFIDIIFASGNAACAVDDAWFERAREATVFGRSVRLCPPEEMIWQKAYVMERERFDGADIVHLVRHCAEELDWAHLLRRFGADGAVLLAHLLLARFVYPHEPELVPGWVIERLLADVPQASAGERPLCNGPLLSRSQYLPDIERWGYADARLERKLLGEDDLLLWTQAAESARPLR